MDKIRQIDYRLALNAFVFTGLWFVIGAVLLWSPIPGALGIGGSMFGAWLVLFFLAMAAAGSLLTIASLNAVFPPRDAAPPTSPSRAAILKRVQTTMWAPGAQSSPPSPANPPHDG